MFDGRDELTAYRLLEFPNETDQSWPVVEREPDQVLVPQLRVSRDRDRTAGGVKKIAG
jgi:hypothetical protein